jgi:hypothetical protein
LRDWKLIWVKATLVGKDAEVTENTPSPSMACTFVDDPCPKPGDHDPLVIFVKTRLLARMIELAEAPPAVEDDSEHASQYSPGARTVLQPTEKIIWPSKLAFVSPAPFVLKDVLELPPAVPVCHP